MRRFLIPSVLLLALAACAPTTQGPSQTIALEQVSAYGGLDVASARQTVVDFLNAYAQSPEDGGIALRLLVGTTKLARWVSWLKVQNESFPGRIRGTPSVRSLEFRRIVPFRGTVAAQVDVRGSVSFQYEPRSGQPFELTRAMDGPVTIVRRGAGDWLVLDATRDGQSMDESIHLLNGLSKTRDGITVRIDSLFTFPPEWSFNVVVENGSADEVALASKRAAILPPVGGALNPSRSKGITPSLATIPPGRREEGSISFAAQSSPSGRILALPFRLGRHIVVFKFPLPDTFSPAPTPSPTAPAPGSPASS